MEQIHILLWIAKPRKMSSESLELVTQVCFSLLYVYLTGGISAIDIVCKG